MATTWRITTRNAAFQQWEALLDNRKKRQRNGEFLVHGVRPITLAVQQGARLRALLHDAGREPSRWAQEIFEASTARRVEMAPELLAELGEKDEDTPELIAVAELPDDDFARIKVGPGFLGVVFDRPTGPGNIGTLVRSADAFGAAGVVVTGHAADPYDPKAVRASTGSLFSVPVVRAPSHREVLAWVGQCRAEGTPVRVVGAEDDAAGPLSGEDLTGPTLLVVGNETRGLSAAWREVCDTVASIPMVGSASSRGPSTRRRWKRSSPSFVRMMR
jgi:23S rRNA (uridine2479-2'-O)-methyltransferase